LINKDYWDGIILVHADTKNYEYINKYTFDKHRLLRLDISSSHKHRKLWINK